ncbi:MAG TPA: aldose 1-epimerase family protein [Prolixibacteraceae bacterium]|nr:aldose 1-epimerase family protein [Prolixibacteraceae bacterium]
MEKSEVLKYVGNLNQIGQCRHYTLSEGWGRGMRATDVNTGSGLQFTVLPDRGMDISLASFNGKNLVYLTCNGETSPVYFEPDGIGWLRTFTGGLLTTCGLTYLGPPCTDNGEQLGLHGRYSTLPTRQFADLSGWEGDNYILKLKGIIEEGYQFGYKLRMERMITSVAGQNSIKITDTISNFGNVASPYTILYHMNLGYPLLSEDAELIIDAESTVPRDADAAPGIHEFKSFTEPKQTYREQVFFHNMKGDDAGKTHAELRNKKLGIALSISFNVAQLPYVTQWKMLGYGEYVLGIEPCNVLCKSRAALREEGNLPFLQPGESVTNEIEVSVADIGKS